MRTGIRDVALVTGGAGFIGSNLTERLLAETELNVRILDNFSRRGVEHNVKALQSLRGCDRLQVVEGDVRDMKVVQRALRGVTEIYHLAAQVAVTTSVSSPLADFGTNALGTLNLLEGAREAGSNPFFLYTSTNKVYGSLSGVPVEPTSTRYKATERCFIGVTEEQLLDFHSPYGCSKGAADQYVRDYARIYDLPTVVFRMSCIAGPRQFGNEDQGWVAHFLYSILAGSTITIYGDGLQVRDLLHVHDLVDAMLAARSSIARTRGQIYNLGGGINRTASVIEMLRLIEDKVGRSASLTRSEVRPGDQPLYISDTSKFQSHTGWRVTRSIDRILEDLLSFWEDNSAIITAQRAPSLIGELVAEEVA